MDVEVVVRGVNPTGLMMAAQLARRDVRYALVETDRCGADVCVLTARAMEHLDRLGLATAIATLAERIDQLAGLIVPFAHDDTRFPGIYAVGRGTLADALRGYPGVTIAHDNARGRFTVICEPTCEPGDTPTTADVREALITGRNTARRPRYRDGSAFLAGELGASEGLGDAVNLAWKLAAVLRGAPAELLDTYARERRPRAMHHHPASIDRLARFASELDVAYKPSRHVREGLAAADDAFVAGLAPGERIPDVDGLYASLTGPGPHVLALGDCEPFARPHQRLRLGPATARLFGMLGVRSAATFVVLPDLHLGFRCFGGKTRELARYLDELAPPALRRLRSAAP